MATKKKKSSSPGKHVAPVIFRYPGKQELSGFLKENSKLFNLSELERVAELPNSTLRHICAGSRSMQTDEYQKLKRAVLPKMCEFILLLQHYD